MIKYKDFQNIQSGELYIEFMPSKAKDVSQTTFARSFYSFDPNERGLSKDKIIDLEVENFTDLMNFLNCDENMLNRNIHRLVLSILQNNPDNDLKESVKALIDTFSSLHTFFKVDTGYHLYDLVIRYIISLVSQLSVSVPRRAFLKGFHSFQKSIIYLFFNFDLKECKEIITFYDGVLKNESAPYAYSWKYVHFSKPCDEITELRDIICEIPAKKFNIKDTEWQIFLYKLYTIYGNITTLAPYTLTNHVKCENITEYRSILRLFGDTNLGDMIKDLVEKAQNNSEKMQTKNHFKESVHSSILKLSKLELSEVDFSSLFKETNKSPCHTYPIDSFPEYIIAELNFLFEKNCNIKRCKMCGQFYLKAGYIEHNCNRSENHIKIQKKYERTISNIDSTYQKNYSGKNSKKGNDNKQMYDYCFSCLKEYHNKVCYQALYNNIPFYIYENFVERPQCKVKAMEKSIDRINRLNDKLNGFKDNEEISQKGFLKILYLKNIYSWQLPDFDECIKLYKKYHKR